MDTRGFNEKDITGSLKDIKDAIAASTAQELPAVTEEDNGKILQVVNGDWNKTEPASGLPEVTSTDNGKILGVVEGEWAKTDAPSSSNRLIVTINDTTKKASKTPTEILDEFNAGKEIYFQATNLSQESQSTSDNDYEVYGTVILSLLNIFNDTGDDELRAIFAGPVHGMFKGSSDTYYTIYVQIYGNYGDIWIWGQFNY